MGGRDRGTEEGCVCVRERESDLRCDNLGFKGSRTHIHLTEIFCHHSSNVR